MSLLVVDHGKIMQRILDILKNNEVLTQDDDKNKVLRKFKIQESDYDITDDVTPYCYISIPSRFASTRDIVGTSQAQRNQQIVEYKLTVMVQAKSVEYVQSSLFFFTDEIVRTLQANPTLKEPVALNDPLVKKLLVKDISRVNKKPGTEQDGMTLTLQLQIGFLWSLTLPGPLTLEGESKPLETVGNMTELDLLDDGSEMETKMYFTGLLDFEFESTDALDTSVKSLISAGTDISATLTAPTGTRVMTVFLKEFRKATPYDAFEKSILSMRIIA